MALSFHDWCAAIVIHRRLLLLVPASLIVLAAFTWYWLLHTEPGSHWIWARVQSKADGALQAQSLQGNLGSGLTIRRFIFATDSMTLGIEELRFVVDIDLLPLQLVISEAVVDDADLEISTSDDVSQSSEVRSVVETPTLPFSMVITDVRANNVTVSGIIPENDIELTEVSLTGSWHEDIVVDHLSAITSSPVEMSLQGSLTNLLESLSWDLQATFAEKTIDVGESDVEVRISEAHAASSGNLNEYLLTAAATLDTPGFELLQLTTAGSGSTVSFDFSETSLRGTGVDLSGNGRIAWGDNWSIESRVSLAALDPGVLLEDWPAEHPIRGELSLLLDKNHLAISDSFLKVGDTAMSVKTEGVIDSVTSVVAGAVRWENAKWPLVGDEPAISSQSGNISVDGTIDDWRIDGDIEVGTPEMPFGQLRVGGNGDRHHLEATIFESKVLGGNVSGHATFNWRDQQPWSTGLVMSGIKLASFADDWPDDINGRVDADGQLLPFLLELRLSDIDAEFLGEPLSANGQVRLSDDQLTASGLKILHGDSRIELDGDPVSLSGLTFKVSVSDASRYLPEANGEFDAAGRVSLHPDQPSFRVNASTDAFAYGEIQVTGVEIVDQSDDKGMVNAEIRAEGLSVLGNDFESITVGLVSDAVTQSLRLDASYSDAEVHLFVAGEVDDIRHPSNWQGELLELGLDIAGEPIARLSAPTAMSLSENGVTIDHSCIDASTGMRLCAQLDWSVGDFLNADAELTDIPVNLVNSFIDTGLRFDQLVNGRINWSRSEETGTTGHAKISMSAGTVVGDDYPDASVVTDTGLLSFDIANGQLLYGTAELPMPGFGHVSAQFSIPDFADGGNSDIDGVFDVDLSDMAVLAALTPLVDTASGEIRADLTLAGTLSEPQLAGELAIIDGSLTILPIGLELDDINLTSLLLEDGQVELSGSFLAGEGRGEIVTRADYLPADGTGFELEVRGENMTLINAPNVTARANLDVRIAYDYITLALDGDVLVSHARVDLSDLTVVSHSESEDVVIVGGELPDDSLLLPHQRENWITGSIGVEFGDDVLVDVGPASAELTGKTVFSWEENLIPVADGRYDLIGSIHAFGQVLEITQGGLRFPKIPANDPFIRIRAEREIYGNSQVKTAGVLVDGTLRQLTVEAYTRPATTEERALTLLVTGSDFDFEQGLGAINFGTYIAPRVFVSYGVGLFETENVIRVRYDLKRGFGITATSGAKESGVDLSYRIER